MRVWYDVLFPDIELIYPQWAIMVQLFCDFMYEWYSGTIEGGAKYPVPWFHKGLAFAPEKKFIDAILAFDTALHVDPGHAKFSNLIGVSYVHSGKSAKKLEDFRRSFEYGN